MKKKIFASICLISLIVLLITTLSMQNNNVEALSKYGSNGSEVRSIQEKLKRWGYYDGNIDGIYGSRTVNAVKKFQQKMGYQ